MFDWFRARAQQGTPTQTFPPARGTLPDRFRGLPVLGQPQCGSSARIPSALMTTKDGRPALDVGACLFSPEEAHSGPAGTVSFTRDYRLAGSSREDLLCATGEAPRVKALEEASRRLFGRSLRLRSVVAGSCGGCEAELVALGNVVFDLARFGIQFVASPRHADGIVITGALNRNMRNAVVRTWEATPQPRLLILVGACAIAGGPFRGSTEVEQDALPDVPVDLYVPGCPPHPLTLLDGMLRLLGQLPQHRIASGRNEAS